MGELIITLADGRTIRHKLGPHPETLGRDANCEIPTDDPSTSRRHARISPTAMGFIVEDLGSKNGTLVNDKPCTSAALRHGDRILIGATHAVFHDSMSHSTTSVVVADDLTQSRATHYLTRDQRLLLSQRRLEMIYDLSERLTTLQSRDGLLEEAMSICVETLHFERSAIGIRRRNQRAVDWPVVRNLRGAEGELTISRTLLSRALEHGERAIFTDDGAARIDPSVSMVQQGIRSAMCVPLLHGDQTLGVIYGDRLSSSTTYTNEDIDFLAAIARQVSIGLINCQLVDDQRQMIRLNHDLDVARSIQNGLFPTNLPNHAKLKVAALNDPGRRVSGDYYDVIEREDGRLWCLIADVTGEGVAAALQMANLQAAVRVSITEADDPGTLLTRWNRFLCQNATRSRFITCLLALVDPASHVVSFASAGHWPPLVARGVGTPPQELDSDAAFPLGVDADTQFPSTRVDIGPDPFVLFCYTDGVSEALDSAGQPFGRERLLRSLADRTDLNPAALVKHVRKQVAGFVGPAEQSDDITMLAAWVA